MLVAGTPLRQTMAHGFATQQMVPSDIFGQVVVRIADCKIIFRGAGTASMDEELRAAIEASGEEIRDARTRAAHPQKIPRTFQHKPMPNGEPRWWMRRVEDDRPHTVVKVEPSDDGRPPLADAIPANESENTVDNAIASFPYLEPLKYDTKIEEGAGRETRPGVPPLEEGDDEPDDDHRSFMPWEQGMWGRAKMASSALDSVMTTSETEAKSTKH